MASDTKTLKSLIALIALVFAATQQAHCRSILDFIPGSDILLDTTSRIFNSIAGDTLSVATDCISCEKRDPDADRNVSEIIRSRGFHVEEYDVVTQDGYILTIQRIVNPRIADDYRPKMKPVIMQHGLMSSSVDWVINSVNVRPEKFPKDVADEENRLDDTQAHPNSLGFYLANRGYDVFLANSRGNKFGQRHVNISSWQPKFWAFTFDEQIKYDLPDTIAFVQRLTKHNKVGYVGHSQGTAMMFGLLSDQPNYADMVEPFIALAPVAYVSNTVSPAKYFALYTPLFQNVNMWFGSSNVAVRYLAPLVCPPGIVRKDLCENIIFLSIGFDEAELDQSRISAYLGHMPSGTSVKNIAHYGQEVISGRFAKFDHGILVNQVRYGQSKPPSYDLTKIRSKSIALFIATNDWLAAPQDVAHLRADMGEKPFAVFNMTEIVPKFNHIDYVYSKHAGEYVNPKIEQVFEHFGGNEITEEPVARTGDA